MTPIVYPRRLVPSRLASLYSLNPMVGIVDGYRWSLLGTPAPDWSTLTMTTLLVAVVLTGGLYYFRRTEQTFADTI